jgi:hypothetical protein
MTAIPRGRRVGVAPTSGFFAHDFFQAGKLVAVESCSRDSYSGRRHGLVQALVMGKGPVSHRWKVLHSIDV